MSGQISGDVLAPVLGDEQFETILRALDGEPLDLQLSIRGSLAIRRTGVPQSVH
jgi:hypothetical protein